MVFGKGKTHTHLPTYSKASSNIESSGIFFYLNLTSIAEFEEFCQTLFVHSTKQVSFGFSKKPLERYQGIN
jgi:hypothetical protein